MADLGNLTMLHGYYTSWYDINGESSSILVSVLKNRIDTYGRSGPSIKSFLYSHLVAVWGRMVFYLFPYDPTEDKMKNHTAGRRLTPQEINDALFYWHLHGGNASKVAKILETSVKTITVLAERENFASKSALVQQRINEMVYNTDDPTLQRMAKVDIRTLEITEMLIEQVYKGVKRKTLKVRNVTEALAILKVVSDVREKILGSSAGPEKREPKGINIGNLNLIDLSPDVRDQLIATLAARVPTRMIEGKGELVG